MEEYEDSMDYVQRLNGHHALIDDSELASDEELEAFEIEFYSTDNYDDPLTYRNTGCVRSFR